VDIYVGLKRIRCCREARTWRDDWQNWDHGDAWPWTV